MEIITKGQVETYCKSIMGQCEGMNTMADINDFLQEPSLQKSGAKRIYAWLAKFRLISSNTSAGAIEILKLHREYQLRFKELNISPEEPLETLPRKVSDVIVADVNRSGAVFSEHLQDGGVVSFPEDGFYIQAYRVFTLTHLQGDEFTYTQGFDRFFLILFVLGLQFCDECDLPYGFAESLTYALLKKFLTVAKISELISGKLPPRFGLIDKELAKRFPEFEAFLKDNFMDSFNFTLRWFIVIFADLHTFSEILLIWDSVLLHLRHTDDYIDGLCLAHIDQMQERQMEISLQVKCDWDTVELVKLADKYMPRFVQKHELDLRNASLVLSLMIILFVLLWTIFYH